MKLCSKCRKVKSINEFYVDKAQKSGYTCRCKKCIGVQQKPYKQTHRQEVADYQRKWCKANRGKRCGYAKKYRGNNKESEYNRIREYRETLKGHIVGMVAGAKQRCENRNNPRYSCYGGRGIRLHFGTGKLYEWCLLNSIDPRGLEIHRIDNDGDYTLDNIEFLTKSEHTTLHNLKG